LTHKGDPVAHQDAPALIETHRLAAGAHHARYTDAEVRALFSPISIPASSFLPFYDTYDYERTRELLKNRVTLTPQYYSAPVIFPPSVTVTKVTLYGYRDDASATLSLYLARVDRVGSLVTMATCVSNWITGYSSIYDDIISYAVINNNNYSYALALIVDADDDVDNVKLSGVKIEFTG